ncbi:hypothetical protein ES288_A10G171300v1 [Gossypium darwinii]|uniref:Uncharacterized protein n=1 Tax=Gossypium darwinii TaxID=34276 RepID=A0A5D2EZL9_GOSDA|nr:hypothetical protein ES288_A10G171300v1 [Gossypium darwinii]
MAEIMEAQKKHGKILFPQLRSLRMENLPQLRGFYVGDTIIDLPNLEEVIVNQCPKLQIFSRLVSAPKLQYVKTSKQGTTARIWSQDLNATVSQLHKGQFTIWMDETESKGKPQVEAAGASGTQREDAVDEKAIPSEKTEVISGVTSELDMPYPISDAESQGTSSSHEIEHEATQKEVEVLELTDHARLSREAASTSALSTPSNIDVVEPVAIIPSSKHDETEVAAATMTTIELSDHVHLSREDASTSALLMPSDEDVKPVAIIPFAKDNDTGVASAAMTTIESTDHFHLSREAASMSALSTPSDIDTVEPVAIVPSYEDDETGVAAATMTTIKSTGHVHLSREAASTSALPFTEATMTTIEQSVSKILECMATHARIALHGVCGTGKSSVLRALVNNPKIKGEFDFIISVTVSKFWTPNKIQDQIKQQLPASSDAIPFQILEGKRLLLLLDDVWEMIDLPNLGIPNLSLENGGMMVLATRELKVCYDMEVTKVVEIEPVSREEAWKLFHDQVGGIDELPNIHHFARGIVEGCCGLPLLIIATGRALSDEENVAIWEDAFNEFSVPGRDVTSCMEDLIQLLKFSFDRLKSRSLKSCFLHCALFSEDQEIDTRKFIEYCIREDLIAGTWSKPYDRGHDIVEALQHALLLETAEDGLSIRMPYVMRDLALGILSSDNSGRQFLLPAYSKQLKREERSLSTRLFIDDHHRFLWRVAARLTELPTEEAWKKAKMMFLIDNELSILPEKPNFPALEMLFLLRNNQLRVLPDLFFDNMPCLAVLNLSKTGIKYLPKSISRLSKLETLILRDCEHLFKLPSEVGSLKPLQVLDLRGTEIVELPAKIAELDSLSHLEVSLYGSSTYSEHDKWPTPFLSRLEALETLRISVYPGDIWWQKSVEFIIKEVSKLKNLTSLSFYFPQVKFLELFLQESISWKEERLTEFKLIVGHDVKFNAPRVPPTVKLNYSSVLGQCLRFVNSEEIPDAVLQVLARCTAFYLDHQLNITSLSEFGNGTINKLKYCIISECPWLGTVVESEEGTEAVFPCLEHLSIHYCWRLACIWEGVVPKGSFAALRSLSLCTCPELTYVFKSSMLLFFSNLEELKVDDCEAIEKIISDDEISEARCISLKSLKLHYLPELVHIGEAPQAKVLFEYIEVYDCPQLNQIFEDSELKQTLKKIRADKDWWNGLEWEEPAVGSYFETVFKEGKE